MTKARKAPGRLRSQARERAIWEREDSTADLDWRRAERVRLPNLQPSTTAISLRLPVSLLEQIKIAAHKRDGASTRGRRGDGVNRHHASLHVVFHMTMKHPGAGIVGAICPVMTVNAVAVGAV